jgi:hypothetical protein
MGRKLRVYRNEGGLVEAFSAGPLLPGLKPIVDWLGCEMRLHQPDLDPYFLKGWWQPNQWVYLSYGANHAKPPTVAMVELARDMFATYLRVTPAELESQELPGKERKREILVSWLRSLADHIEDGRRCKYFDDWEKKDE